MAGHSGSGLPSILTGRFSQDSSCLAVGTATGFQLYTCEPFALTATCNRGDDGGVRVLEMLFSSSLVAFVGAGQKPGDSPRQLRLWNMVSNELICELSFASAVIGVRMNRTRLLAILESRIHVFELSTMKLLHTVETANNPRGLLALSSSAETASCVFPASGVGEVIYYDAKHLHALSTISAHRGALACLSLSTCGSLVATASERGTVVRVHSFPEGVPQHTLRRGSVAATIYSLAFSPGVFRGDKSERGAQLLCASSSTGTVHVWSLNAQRGAVTSAKANAGVQLPLFTGERDFASVKLRTAPGTHSTAALRDSRHGTRPGEVAHSLYVLTAEGAWFSYLLDPLCGDKCLLQDERRVLGTK